MSETQLRFDVRPAIAIIIHPSPEGGFWAEVPAFLGHVYAEGETVEETRRNAECALADYFQRRADSQAAFDAEHPPLSARKARSRTSRQS